jgi:hypothetical protein
VFISFKKEADCLLRKFKKQYKDFVRNSVLFFPSYKLKPFKHYDQVIDRLEKFQNGFSCAQIESKSCINKQRDESFADSTHEIVDDTLVESLNEPLHSSTYETRSQRNSNRFYVGDAQVASQAPTQSNTQICEEVQSSMGALNLSGTQFEKKLRGINKNAHAQKQESSIINDTFLHSESITNSQVDIQQIQEIIVSNKSRKSRKKCAADDDENVFKTPSASNRSESSNKRVKRDILDSNDSRLYSSTPVTSQHFQTSGTCYPVERLKLSDFSIPYTIRLYNNDEQESVHKLSKDFLINMREDTTWLNNF